MKKKIVLVSFALVLSLVLFAGCGSSEGNADPLKAVCNNGVMVGQEENGVVSFLGVPYAKPPVDELRWKAPVAAEDSDEEIVCDEFGLTPIQYEWATEPASYTERGEDCLTLNVWTAKESTEEPKAVMVWFYGGAYSWGGTTDPMYDGQNFVEANPDIVLVTVNYRLGVMAWADFSQIPGGEEYTDLNLGIRDQICALEWIQKNIGSFGGNPDNVTIYGESAGAVSTSVLLISPKAEGLFHKVIVQSDAIDSRVIGTVDDAREYGKLIAETAGAEDMDDLLAVTAEEWIELDTEYWLGDESPGTVADGDIIPFDYEDAVTAAGKKGIPVMIGSNADERNYDVEELEGYDNFVEYMNESWDDTYDKVPEAGKKLMDEFMDLQLEAGKDELFAKVEFLNESSMRIPEILQSEKFTEGGGTTYMYYWDVPSTSETYFKGACHAVELAYVFNNLEDTIYCGENPDEATAAKAQEAWANFAKTGNPSIEGTEWLPYDKEDRNTMIITLDGWKMEKDPLSRSREIVSQLITEYGINE